MDGASNLIEHTACPCGSSSDALAVYDDGHSFCFSCDKYFGERQEECVNSELINGLSTVALSKRNISETTCRKFGYGRGEYKGQTVQVAPYYDESGKLVAQKVRFANKDMITLGDMKKATLFGQKLFRSGNKRIVVTEGESDARAVFEAMPNWPVVSIKSGAAGAKRSFKENIEYLES